MHIVHTHRTHTCTHTHPHTCTHTYTHTYTHTLHAHITCTHYMHTQYPPPYPGAYLNSCESAAARQAASSPICCFTRSMPGWKLLPCCSMRPRKHQKVWKGVGGRRLTGSGLATAVLQHEATDAPNKVLKGAWGTGLAGSGLAGCVEEVVGCGLRGLR